MLGVVARPAALHVLADARAKNKVSEPAAQRAHPALCESRGRYPASRRHKPGPHTDGGGTARKLAILLHQTLKGDFVYRDPGADVYDANSAPASSAVCVNVPTNLGLPTSIARRVRCSEDSLLGVPRVFLPAPQAIANNTPLLATSSQELSAGRARFTLPLGYAFSHAAHSALSLTTSSGR